jgi:hypothetical protein
MHTTGMSFKAIGRQMGYHYSVASRLVRKHTQTNNVKDLPRSSRQPSSGRLLHEAETVSRLTNGSCAMSLNSNHVVLNTMPNVIVDSVASRLVRKHTQTNNVKDLPRSSRPRLTSDSDDRALQRLVRRMPFATQKPSLV